MCSVIYTVYMQWLRYGKTGKKKRPTCLAILLQNKLNSDVVRFTTGLNVGSKTQNKLNSDVVRFTTHVQTC